MLSTTAPWFVSDGVGPDMISGGEPRLRRSRHAGDGSESRGLRLASLVRRRRPGSPRIAVLGR
jgi:hypothetical protein